MDKADFEAVIDEAISRLPHLAMGLPKAELKREIARTTWHEIAHYFGLDDAHLEEIGWG